MTNEEAYEKFILSDDWQEIRLHTQNSDELAEEVWQAAIVYMQEQSEPELVVRDNGHQIYIAKCNGDYFDISKYVGVKFYTTPQRPQPLKQLSDEQISLMAFNDDQNDWDSLQFKECWHEGYIKGAKAIMDAMQEINKK